MSTHTQTQPNSPTRIKICGITRIADALAAARLGTDAIGLVFVRKSPRFVALENAAEIVRALPPFVASVALFVNPTRAEVDTVIEHVRPDVLQFHGEETPEFCSAFNRPFLKAARVKPGMDLLQYAADFSSAQGILFDAYSPNAHGGTGHAFDWALIPPDLPRPLILAGGLDPDNVADAVRQVRPWAVDVSSGVEAEKGIKDVAKMATFIEAVRNANA